MIISHEIVGRLLLNPLLFFRGNEHPDMLCDIFGNFRLKIKNILCVAIILLRPQMPVLCRFNQLNGKFDLIIDLLSARMLEKYQDFKNLTASDIMSPNPKTIGSDTLVVDALGIMRKNNITQLLVVDGTKYVGVIHLHDILREGII